MQADKQGTQTYLELVEVPGIGKPQVHHAGETRAPVFLETQGDGY